LVNQAQISCIIPTHNRIDFLLDAVNSVLDQQYAPLEILVVDDYGKLDLDRILAPLNEKSPIPIHLIKNPQPGAPASRNLGVKSAKGKYIALLDDDDYWEPDYLLKQIHLLIEKKRDMVISPVNTWNPEEGTLFPKRFNLFEGWSLNDYMGINPGFLGSNFLISKKVYQALGGFDLELQKSQDLDFFIHFLEKGYSFVLQKEPLLRYRVHNSGNISKKWAGKKEIYHSFRYFLKKHFTYLSFRAKWFLRLLESKAVKGREFSMVERVKGRFFLGISFLTFWLFVPLYVYLSIFSDTLLWVWLRHLRRKN